MRQPRFTFCIPNLNKIKYLPACIESVLAQDCEDWRCVFVDGYSTDGSWEYIQQFASDPRFFIRRGIKQGMYADWNECLKHVDTDYFYILTSDDTCFPSLVSTTVNALNQYPDVAACHFQYALIDEAGEIMRSPEDITQKDFELYTEVNRFPHRRNGLTEFMMHFAYRALYRTITSLVFRKILIDKLTGFKTIYGPAGDHDWTMRMVLQTDVIYIPELLATWRRYDEQASVQVTVQKYLENSLSLAKDNVDQLIKREAEFNLNTSLNRRQLLAWYLDDHASCLFNKILASKNAEEFTKNIIILIKNYPFYILRKIVNRLSQDRYFIYPSKLSRALDFIDTYGIDWPPRTIELNSKSLPRNY